MDKKMIKIKIILMIAIVAAVILVFEFIAIKRTTHYYGRTNSVFYNPLMGFAPAADYKEAVGENTLVYVDITWREWEPEEGKFNSEKVVEENYLEEWRSLNKKVVLRFICDIPSEEAHRDIPDWLYEDTADGNNYNCAYGKGYSPNYNNPVFIKAHTKAIEALGEVFGQDSFICYVELGSLGHWGEWHVKYDEGINRFPSEKICEEYVVPYVKAFPHAKLLMRRTFQPVMDYNMGVYNDMAGDEEATAQLLGWIKNGGVYEGSESPMKLISRPNIWEKSPVGGEFTSSLSMRELLETQIDQTVKLLKESHMTFIGPKCPIANQEALQYPQGTATVLNNLGYRYGIRECKVIENTWSGKVKLQLLFENSGTAPIYFNWPVYIYILDENKNVIEKQKVKINLSEVAQSATKEVSISFNRNHYKSIQYTVGVGIENPDSEKPDVSLDMECDRYGKIAILY
ncbi:MAG: DUF4832 domain-containing protein [Anaerotignum sp.]|nr:DUF4832 domain-containing protein [Anaerotignum sp.]